MFEIKLQELPEDIREIRKRILSEIQLTLEKCRNRISWNDKSELKLYLWLNGRREIKLYSSKLSDLFLIRGNLLEYINVHEKMDEDMLLGREWKTCGECDKIYL